MTEPVDYEHLIRSLTDAQRATLDQLATGATTGHSGVLRRLEALDLIVGYKRSIGFFSWTEYEVPIHVHIAWAAVCSAEFDALSPEEQAAMEGPEEA